MLYGQVDEFLVVCVAAGHAGFGGNFDEAGVVIEFGQHVLQSQLVERQSGCDFWVGQYASQFVAHGLGGQPVEFVICQRLPYGLGGGVVEDKGVEDDVGVEDDGLGWHRQFGSGDALTLTLSQRERELRDFLSQWERE